MIRRVSRARPRATPPQCTFRLHLPHSRPASTASSSSLKTFSRVGAALFFGAGLSGSAYLFFLSNSPEPRPLSPFYWSTVTIESSEPSASDPSTKLITLRIPQSLVASQSSDNSTSSVIHPIHSIYVKDSDIQVERPYTPLFGIAPPLPAQKPPTSDSGEDQAHLASFWIKKYPHGEVGRWLHSKQPGDTLEIRGPVVTLDFEKEMRKGGFDEVVMVRSAAFSPSALL